MLTAIFSQPRTDEIHRSKIVNRLLLSLFAARKLNYIIIYIHHYKTLKKKKENYNCIQEIARQKQIKGKLDAANDLNFLQKFGIGSTKMRKTSVLPKLWEGFIHPRIDRMNKFFARLVQTGGTLYSWLLHRL